MTAHGAKLASLTPEEVIDRLSTESNSKAIKRLVAAREYLAGSSPAAISTKYGWPEQTIYSWLDRLESHDLDEALYDDAPPGRPPALTPDELDQFRDVVSTPATGVGFDSPTWTTALAQEFILQEFGHEYSRRHVRRLLKNAGVQRTPPESE